MRLAAVVRSLLRMQEADYLPFVKSYLDAEKAFETPFKSAQAVIKQQNAKPKAKAKRGKNAVPEE